MFSKIDITGLNLNTNFVFFQQKSIELLLFKYGPSSFTLNSEFNYVPIEGWKNRKSNIFFTDLAFKYFFLCGEINSPEVKFWYKITFVASYSRDLIASKMCRKVNLGHSFDNSLLTVRNFYMRAECF